MEKKRICPAPHTGGVEVELEEIEGQKGWGMFCNVCGGNKIYWGIKEEDKPQMKDWDKPDVRMTLMEEDEPVGFNTNEKETINFSFEIGDE